MASTPNDKPAEKPSDKPKQDSTPTIIIGDHPEQKKYELLKEKLRYKQATRENSRKIDHKEVRLSIQAGALPTKTFFIMNTLAAVIAGYGLLANSPAVVIGAMLVAMMLGPISGMALALIDNRMLLLATAAKTLAGGVMAVIVVGFVLGLIHHDIALTPEIISRTRPNVMDLMIALAGGAAGAFSSISPRLSVAVVGVAVATALVPPLVASGILLAHFEWSLASGAFVLAFTNMVAIQFSSSLVLWMAGFRRITSDELDNSSVVSFVRRNIVSLMVLVGLTVYLTINLISSMAVQRYQTDTRGILEQQLSTGNNFVDTIKFTPNPLDNTIKVVVLGDKAPTLAEVQRIEQQLQQLKNSPHTLPPRLAIQFVPTTMIFSQTPR